MSITCISLSLSNFVINGLVYMYITKIFQHYNHLPQVIDRENDPHALTSV